MMENIYIKIGDEIIEVKSKYNLTFAEMLQFVNSIVTTVFDESDGSYMPELFDFAVRRSTIAAYTDLKLPDEIDAVYSILYDTDLIEQIVNATSLFKVNEYVIDMAQYDAAVEAAQRKIDYLAAKSKTDELVETLTETAKRLGDTFSEIDLPVLMTALGSVSDIDAKSVVQAFVENR